MAIKHGDFIQLDYIGRVDGRIFDLTDADVAKKEKIHNSKAKYGSVTIVVGAGHLLKGIDEALVGKEVGEKISVEVPPEKGFGKKSSKLIKIIPERSFKEQKVQVHAGMQVNIDGLIGNVISASAGRVILDFNHPLASKTLNYDVSILKKIDGQKEQLASLIEMYTNIKLDADKIEVSEHNAKVNIKKLDEKMEKHIEDEAKKYIGLKKVEFTEEKTKEKKE